MDQQLIIDFMRQAILMVITISAPIMLAGLCVGLIVALFQALTQIQEMTLAFVPKIVIVFTMVYLLFPMFSTKMIQFMNVISDQIIAGGP